MDKPYKCPVDGCNASYAKSFKLKIHLRKHSKERPFICDIPGCLSSYTNVAHLKRHKCLVHEESCEVMCKFEGCGLVLNNKYSLKKHYNQKHNVVNYKFTCEKCHQSYKKRSQLNQHLQTHVGELPLKCSSCNIGFAEVHLYNKHKRNHKTYTCDCGEKFEKWTLFRTHRKKSCSIKKIDHKCIICNKIFTTKFNLQQHSLTHVEESKVDVYRCPYINCKRSYKYKKNLTSHVAVFHEKVNEDNPLKCTVSGCEQILKSKRNLNRHIINKHSGLPSKKKERKQRRDKGKSKKCMASIMSGIELPLKEHLTFINSNNLTTNLCITNITAENRTLNKINGINKKKENNLMEERQEDNRAVPGDANDDTLLNDDLENKSSSGPEEKKQNSKQTFVKIVCSLQKPIGTKNLPEPEEKTQSDDILLQYCDDTLKTLQGHLSGDHILAHT